MFGRKNKDNSQSVDTDSEQKHIGGDAKSEVTTTRDTNITIHIININSNDKDTLELIKHVLGKAQPNLKTSIENDEKLEEQKKSWEETNGVFTLAENLDEIEQLIGVISFSERRKELTKKLEDIIGILMAEDKMHLVNAINIVCKEDEINELEDEDTIIEKSYELAEIKANIKLSDYKIRNRYKKIYNLLRSNDFEENILPKFLKIREENSNQLDINIKFLSYWNDILNNHPNKVFYSHEVSSDENIEIAKELAKEQIVSKLRKTKKRVYLYARGMGSIKVCKECTEEILKECSNICSDVLMERQSIAKRKAMKFIFIGKE